MIVFELLHPDMEYDMLGYLPHFFDPADPRPAREQIDANYISGWHPIDNSAIRFDLATGVYTYPGDPQQRPIAKAKLRNETLYFYQHEVLVIMQENGSYEIARVN